MTATFQRSFLYMETPFEPYLCYCGINRPQKPPNIVLYHIKFSQPYSQYPAWARAYVRSRLSLVIFSLHQYHYKMILFLGYNIWRKLKMKFNLNHPHINSDNLDFSTICKYLLWIFWLHWSLYSNIFSFPNRCCTKYFKVLLA